MLEDAERRRLRDPDVNTWVVKLKDVMYDADDINDLCRLKDEQKVQESTSFIDRVVRNQPSFSLVSVTSEIFAIELKALKLGLRKSQGIHGLYLGWNPVEESQEGLIKDRLTLYLSRLLWGI